MRLLGVQRGPDLYGAMPGQLLSKRWSSVREPGVLGSAWALPGHVFYLQGSNIEWRRHKRR